MLLFSLYIVCIIYNMLYCYFFEKIILKQKFMITIKKLLCCSIAAVFLCFDFYYNQSIFKPFVSHIIAFANILICYEESIFKTLVSIFVTFLIVSISELIYAVISIYIFHINTEFLNNNTFGIIITNTCIMAIS